MSEKAVGFDWKFGGYANLRHAAGCEKYTTLKKDRKNLKKNENTEKIEEK